MSQLRTIATRVHGRYFVHALSTSPRGIVVGCHGYAENADVQLERLRRIPGSDEWVLVSVQGLNRFYRGRTEAVVASWMTREDRELMIADNVEYVGAVVAAVRRQHPAPDVVVFAGFSQGVAMAFRAACASAVKSSVIATGGDIPPELDAAALGRLAGVLIGHGTRDDWYTDAKFGTDLARLRDAGVPVQPLILDVGHEWSEPFSQAAGEFLARLS